MKLVWEDYMEEEEEKLIMELFGVTFDVAKEALRKVGKNKDKLRNHIKNISPIPAGINKCKACGKTLTDPVSIRRGYGKECYKKIKKNIYIDIFGGN